MQRISILVIVITGVVLAISVLADGRSGGGGAGGDGIALAQQPAPPPSGAPQTFALAPKSDIIDDIICHIECILAYPISTIPPECCDFCPDLCELGGVRAVEDAIVGGAIPSQLKPWASDVLDKVEALILQIQGAAYPDLTPRNAGQPGSSETFTSLTSCAQKCVQWAEEALNEAESPSPDHAYIGYRLDSIKRALPQYRDLAGL
jgi:hypothetical protein